MIVTQRQASFYASEFSYPRARGQSTYIHTFLKRSLNTGLIRNDPAGANMIAVRGGGAEGNLKSYVHTKCFLNYLIVLVMQRLKLRIPTAGAMAWYG